MAEFQWALDATTGVFKNHALSAKLREAAIAATKCMEHVDPEPGYGKRMGDTVTIPRISNIAEPTTAKFSEGDQVPVDTFAMSTTSVTVSYWGRAVRLSDFAQMLSSFDLKDKIQRKLLQQQRLVLDSGAATAFKAGQIKFQPTSLSGGTFATNGTASTTALENLTVAHVKTIRDYMQDTLHVPGRNGGDDYVGLASTKACRGIKNDPEFMEWHKYVGPDKLYTGEIGKIENVRFIEVNHTNALSNAKGSGSVLGEAVIFGDDAVTMAIVQDPELRIAIPGNFGLSLGVAWIGVLEFLQTWGDSASDGEARVVHVTSA